MKTQSTPQITHTTRIDHWSNSSTLAIAVARNGQFSTLLDKSTTLSIAELIASCGFKGEADDSLLLNVDIESIAPAKRILLIGAGDPEDLDSPSIQVNTAATAIRKARSLHAKQIVYAPINLDAGSLSAGFTARGAVLGLYENGLYQKPKDETVVEKITLLVESGETEGNYVQRSIVVAESMNWARELADEPGGSLPPREFARRAAQMAQQFGLIVESLSAAQIRELGMGGLWGVGQGSAEEPALIVLRYEPDAPTEPDELLAFVGKGITFDTGGISIKPALGMEEMKSDMAGGAAALGAMRAIAQLNPSRRAVAIVPTAENMPSGRALKPGDVIKTLGGFTVEVVDTDAEGRLVLIDGIAYARKMGATRIVDLATLTGSIIVALGDFCAGLFSNNDEWAGQVTKAAAATGERVWRMPVSDDYKKLIESMVADFKNYGGKPDATGAALLLSKFAGATPWAHLDIAATAWLEHATSYAPAGATGSGIPTLVKLACG